MKVIILEDEQPNIDLLTDYIKRYNSKIEIIQIFKNKQDARKWLIINPQTIDLVFSDIELLDGNVFSLLDENRISSPIIFTTAYNDFYQNAFDANGIAYLLKPYSYARFSHAMEKFERMFTETNEPINWNHITELLHKKPKEYKERIMIKNKEELHIVNLLETMAILSHSGKLTAIDASGKGHEFRYKLSDLIEELNPKEFFQINRGEIINVRYIENIETYFGDRLSLKLKNYRHLFITSASNTADFRKWLG